VLTMGRRTRMASFTSATHHKILKEPSSSSRARWDGFELAVHPGWDLPWSAIEVAGEKKKHGRPASKLDAGAFRALCRAYAQSSQLELPTRAISKRLRCWSDWDHPIETMDPSYEASNCALARSSPKAIFIRVEAPRSLVVSIVVRRWPSRSRVRRAVSPAIDVAVRVVASQDLAIVSVSCSGRWSMRISMFFVIWTTTPWTCPTNQAVALRGEFRTCSSRRTRVWYAHQMILAADLNSSRMFATLGMTMDCTLGRRPGAPSKG